jgi:hypothetical protein
MLRRATHSRRINRHGVHGHGMHTWRHGVRPRRAHSCSFRCVAPATNDLHPRCTTVPACGMWRWWLVRGARFLSMVGWMRVWVGEMCKRWWRGGSGCMRGRCGRCCGRGRGRGRDRGRCHRVGGRCRSSSLWLRRLWSRGVQCHHQTSLLYIIARGNLTPPRPIPVVVEF